VTAFAFANLMVSVFAVGTSLTELRPRALALTYHLPPVPLTMPSVPAVAKTAVKTAAQPMRGWGAMEDDGGPPFVRPAPPLTPKLPRHVEVWQPPPIPPPPLPPIDEERPLLWKEVCLHSFTRGRVGPATPALMGAIVVAAVLLGLMLIVVLTDRNAGLHEIAQLGTIVVKVVTVAVGSILGLAAILHTTNSIVRERERDTLDALLTLPFDRVMLLEAKWLGGLYDLRALPMILGLGWLFGLVTGGLHPIALFWLICCVLAPIEFLASLGLWLSAVNRSSRAGLLGGLPARMSSIGSMTPDPNR
jgi:hypothetical protein